MNQSEDKKKNLKIYLELMRKTKPEHKQLINNWVKAVYGQPLALFVQGAQEEQMKQMMVEIDKAIEADNWTFFDPENNVPASGQAVTIQPISAEVNPPVPDTHEKQTDEDQPASDTSTSDEDEDQSDLRSSEDSPAEEQPPADTERTITPTPAKTNPPPVDKINGHAPKDIEVVTESAAPKKEEEPPAKTQDSLAPFIDLIVNRVFNRLGGEQHIHQVNGFPVQKVEEIWDTRHVKMVLSYLHSQPGHIVDRAIAEYKGGVQ